MLRIAIAINKNQDVQNAHFGEARSYKIIDIYPNSIIHGTVISNPFYNQEEEKKHGNQNKGKAIAELLINNHVDAIVSMQFGKNIKVIKVKNFRCLLIVYKYLNS